MIKHLFSKRIKKVLLVEYVSHPIIFYND